jgi:hypothetical protein
MMTDDVVTIGYEEVVVEVALDLILTGLTEMVHVIIRLISRISQRQVYQIVKIHFAIIRILVSEYKVIVSIRDLLYVKLAASLVVRLIARHSLSEPSPHTSNFFRDK